VEDEVTAEARRQGSLNNEENEAFMSMIISVPNQETW
jgi:hypothetical protein